MSSKLRPRSLRSSVGVLFAVSVACTDNATETTIPCFDFDFCDGSQGWVAQFSDYPAGDEALFELASGYRRLPPPLSSRGGLFISGNNHSDDLFMYLKRRVGGFEPNTNSPRFRVKASRSSPRTVVTTFSSMSPNS